MPHKVHLWSATNADQTRVTACGKHYRADGRLVGGVGRGLDALPLAEFIKLDFSGPRAACRKCFDKS